MTAMSAQRASETPSLAERTVLLPGSLATYANRAYLRELGLRWDPERHRWHGTIPAKEVHVLREQLWLEVRCVGSLEPPRGPTPPEPPAPNKIQTYPRPPTLEPAPASRQQSPRCVRDGSRTRFESRVLFPEAEDDGFDDHEFTLLEITSGLPDDSREADEHVAERQLRDLCGRVKAVRAVIETTPGLFDLLTRDQGKTVLFCGRYGITERMLVRGVEAGDVQDADVADMVRTLADWVEEVRAQKHAALPWPEDTRDRDG